MRVPAGTSAAVLLAAAVTWTGRPPASPVDAPRPSCVAVSGGPWSPRPGADLAPFLVLPSRLTLEEDVGVDGPETGRSLVRPRQALGSRVRWAYYLQPGESFDLQVVFVNDVTSVKLNLYERSWGWIGDGVAETGTGAMHRRQVRLERVPCGVPS